MNFNLVSILHKSSFSLFLVGSKSTYEEIKVDFPESVVSKSDIFDVEKFAFALKTELIKRPDLKGSEILFLIPEEKIFTKTVALSGTTQDAEKARLFAEIPITEEETHLTIWSKGNQVEFVAVPKKLISTIELSLSKVGFKSVFLPLSQLIAFGFGTGKKQLVGFTLDNHFNLLGVTRDSLFFGKEIDLEKDKVEEIAEEIKKVQITPGMEEVEGVILLNPEDNIKEGLEASGLKVGLVQSTPNLYATLFKIISNNKGNITKFLLGEKKATRRVSVSFPFKKILSMLAIIGFLFLLGGLFVYFKDLGSKNPAPVALTPIPTPLVTTSPTPVASSSAKVATPSSSLVKKADLKIKIYNGNGLPGDAGRFQKKLTALGYTNSETDTKSVQGQRVTELKLASKVTEEFKQEILTALQTDYSEVKTTSDLATGVDVEINTGARK